MHGKHALSICAFPRRRRNRGRTQTAGPEPFSSAGRVDLFTQKVLAHGLTLTPYELDGLRNLGKRRSYFDSVVSALEFGVNCP